MDISSRLPDTDPSRHLVTIDFGLEDVQVATDAVLKVQLDSGRWGDAVLTAKELLRLSRLYRDQLNARLAMMPRSVRPIDLEHAAESLLTRANAHVASRIAVEQALLEQALRSAASNVDPKVRGEATHVAEMLRDAIATLNLSSLVHPRVAGRSIESNNRPSEFHSPCNSVPNWLWVLGAVLIGPVTSITCFRDHFIWAMVAFLVGVFILATAKFLEVIRTERNFRLPVALRLAFFRKASVSTAIAIAIAVTALSVEGFLLYRSIVDPYDFEFDFAYRLGFPVALAAVAYAGTFIINITELHWSSMKHYPRGALIWTKSTNDTITTSAPSMSASVMRARERLVRLAHDVHVDLQGPEITQIRLTIGPDFNVYRYGDDHIMELGLLGLAALDEKELAAVIAHELAHFITGACLDKVEAERFTATFYSFLEERRAERISHRKRVNRPRTRQETLATWLFFGWYFRPIRDAALRRSEDAFFSFATRLAEHHLLQLRAVQPGEAEILKEAEFACDKLAARHSTPIILARALIRSDFAVLAYKAWFDFRRFTTRDRRESARVALQRAATPSSSLRPKFRALQAKLYHGEPRLHPPTKERIEKLGIEWSGPDLDYGVPLPVFTLDEAVDVWVWLTDVDALNLPECERIARRSERSLTLGFRATFPTRECETELRAWYEELESSDSEVGVL